MSDAEELDGILHLVKCERSRQDTIWGGPAHDDGHTWRHWLSYINSQISKMRNTTPERMDKGQLFEARMIKVAALAVAAIQSQRRIHADPSTRNPGL